MRGELVQINTEGSYQIRSYVGRKNVFENVGADPVAALEALQRAEQREALKTTSEAMGIAVPDTEALQRVRLNKHRDGYLSHLRQMGHMESQQTSGTAVNDFLAATKHIYEDQIHKTSIGRFYDYLRAKGNSDRTIYNKYVLVMAWFKWMGLDTKKISTKAPSFEKKDVTIYESGDIKKLMSLASPYQKIVFETLLKTGLRMQEAMYLEWASVDFKQKIVRVRSSSDGAFKIKDKAERSVPLPDDLAVSLKAWRKERLSHTLVLGTEDDKPNWKWLLSLKRLAKRANLNCGRCKTCKEFGRCDHWKLHRFRGTYTTTLLRNGIDVRTVMAFTGHEDMETVMSYLKPLETNQMQAKISNIVW